MNMHVYGHRQLCTYTEVKTGGWYGMQTLCAHKGPHHGESPSPWPTHWTHIPVLSEKAFGSHWGLIEELCLWSHSNSTMITNQHWRSTTANWVPSHQHLFSCAVTSELLPHAGNIGITFLDGLHGVLGTASFPKPSWDKVDLSLREYLVAWWDDASRAFC